jgi:hypothetical protein
MQLEHINRADCAKLQASIEKRGAFNVADKARTWLKKIFSQAIARGGCANTIRLQNFMPSRWRRLPLSTLRICVKASCRNFFRR